MIRALQLLVNKLHSNSSRHVAESPPRRSRFGNSGANFPRKTSAANYLSCGEKPLVDDGRLSVKEVPRLQHSPPRMPCNAL
jgi:hypothetical protein